MIIKNKGFSLVSALFILVVLATVSAFALSIFGITNSTSSFSIQGTRAFFAARSGLEWGIHEVFNNPTTCPPLTSLNINQGGLKNLNVSISCTVCPIMEGTTTYNMFILTALAEQGMFGSIDYVSREMQVSVILAS